MTKSTLIDSKATYHPIESWAYDRYIAPAVTEALVERVRGVLDRLSSGWREVGGDLLDVGCGGGQNALTLARLYPGLRISGVDLSADQVRRARRRAASAAVRFLEGDALHLPFEEARFDLVMSVGSIKHWPSPRRGLEECLRVLRPGGTLVVAEVDRGARRDVSRAFVQRFRIPRWLEAPATISFDRLVVRRSLDVAEASGLLVDLSVDGATVELVEGLPAWLLTGTRPAR